VDIRQCCKTVICSYDHQPRFFVPIRNPSGSFLRVLLPDELKQIQGFPADYQIVGNWKQQVTQIGNAVPSPLIQHVVQHILNGGADTDADDNTKET
jgi:DNA (cytosine-5)-methyltransferase 1